MVLVDEGIVGHASDSIIMTRYKKIKLFAQYDPQIPNIRIPYHEGFEQITNLVAQTVKWENNHAVITRVEPAQIFKNSVDKVNKELIFAFPNVSAGCILEYQYHWSSSYFYVPTWFFQNNLPQAVSKFSTLLPARSVFSVVKKGDSTYTKDTRTIIPKINGDSLVVHTWVKANVHSVSVEPFTDWQNSGLQYISLKYNDAEKSAGDSAPWHDVASDLFTDADFFNQRHANVPGTSRFIDSVKKFASAEQKIAAIFDTVKTQIKWNGNDYWQTDKGVRSAWNNRIGNATEINLALYNLLRKVGIVAHIMFVCTPDNGYIDPTNPERHHIDKVVISVGADSTRQYVLDASNKYNTYTEIPLSLLNTYGILCPGNKKSSQGTDYQAVLLKTDEPAIETIATEAVIAPDGRMTATGTLNSYTYNKAYFHEAHDKLNSEDYINKLKGDDKSLKLTDLTIENIETDSLPLIQKFKLSKQQTTDGGFIYLKTNYLSIINGNPFTNATRLADIDFKACTSDNINSRYQLPAGYNVDAMPENIQMKLFDNSIIFKRLASVDNHILTIHYTIIHGRSRYNASEYTALHDFYRKMFQALDEPIVLKKL